MTFRDLVDQDHAIRLLRTAIRVEKVSHAYLFVGPSGTGRMAVALAFAQALLCERPSGGDACGECEGCRRVVRAVHPDVAVIRPDGDSMKIEQIRDLKHAAQFPPYEGGWRIFVLDDAEAMTAEAQNSLLKLLEEPPARVVLVLIAESAAGLLPTVVSRCQLVRFSLVPAGDIEEALASRKGLPSERAQFLAALAAGRVATALRWADQDDPFAEREVALGLARAAEGGDVLAQIQMAEELARSRDRLPEILDLALLWYRDALVWRESRDPSLLVNRDRESEVAELAQADGRALRDRIAAIEQTRDAVRRNVNARLALEALLFGASGQPAGRT